MNKWIDEWMVVNISGELATRIDAVGATSRADTDSGTYSEEEEEDDCGTSSSSMPCTLISDDPNHSSANDTKVCTKGRENPKF